MLATGALVSALALAVAGTQAQGFNDSARCTQLASQLQAQASSLNLTYPYKLVANEWLEAGSSYNDTARGGFNTVVAKNISAHCRFSANITTSNMSSVRFELWLPSNAVWNNKFIMVGNGGDQGFVGVDIMTTMLGKYNYAVASTNTGHDGDSGNGTFALNNPESQIDFGYRAVHLTTVYSKAITALYYGMKPVYSYWSGCSSGGKQGLKEIQMFPEDYDAALVGAPANWWSHLNGWTQRVNAITNSPNSTGFIAPNRWAPLAAEVLAQCDMLDGVKDNVITQPGKCFLDYSRFTCGSNNTAPSNNSTLNSTSCLTPSQVTTLKNIHTNWTDPSTGKLVFPAFNIGGEGSYGGTINGIPYGPAPSYFLYQILNVTQLVLPYSTPALTINGQPVNDSQLLQLVYEGDRTNPGQTTAINPDLSPFFKRGGKLLHYVGGADPLIPTNNSLYYHQTVVDKLGNVSDSYQFYVVPGMGHCSGGAGADSFGSASQSQPYLGGNGQSPIFDPKYDALLALAQWREKGVRPEELIATKYVNANSSQGIAFQRKLCPYPLVSTYMGGNTTDQASYQCKLGA